MLFPCNGTLVGTCLASKCKTFGYPLDRNGTPNAEQQDAKRPTNLHRKLSFEAKANFFFAYHIYIQTVTQKPEIRRYLRPLDLNFETIDLWKTFCKYYSNKIRLSVNVSHTLQNRNINTGRLSFFETKKTLPAGIFLLFFDYFCIVITLSGKSEIRHIKNHSNTLWIIKK